MGGHVLVLVQGGGGAHACACVSAFSGRLVSFWVLFRFELLLLPLALTLASEATTPNTTFPRVPTPNQTTGSNPCYSHAARSPRGEVSDRG